MLDAVGDGVERRMAVNLAFRRVEEFAAIFRLRSNDFAGLHHPNWAAFAAAGVGIAGILQRHLIIGSVQTADVTMG